MRKIIPYTPAEQEQDPPLRVAVVQYGPSAVEIVLVDENGKLIHGGPYLLRISEDGVCLYKNISSGYGFPLDEQRRLVLVEGE